MNNKKKIVAIWEHYLTKEIGIEFKACLYFFCILFFYSVYRVICGSYDASIIHMGEMICLTYVMGYLQTYLLSNFDEAEQLKSKEISYAILCALIYTGFSFFFNWFDQNIAVSVGFTVYILFIYGCAFLVYKSKREIDERLLNDDLKAFQERRKNGEGSRKE